MTNPIIVNTVADEQWLESIIRLYQALPLFGDNGRQPDNSGLSYWYDQRTALGYDLNKLAAGFVIPEINLHSPSEFVEFMYHSVLGRDSDAAGKAYWVDAIAHGTTYASVLLNFSESNEFKAAVAAGVQDVVSKAKAGLSIDPYQDLAGAPVYHPAPVTVIKEVPVEVPVIVDHYINVNVPTAEAHVLSFNADGALSILAQKPDGTFISGTGAESVNWAALTDKTGNFEIATHLIHRQSGEDINPIASGVNGNRAWVEFNTDAGFQDGQHGVGVNVNRSDAQINFAFSGAPGFMTDGDTQYRIKFLKDTDPGPADQWQLVNTITLTALPNGQQAWLNPDNSIAIGDDPTSTIVAANSMNMGFGYAYGQPDLPAGRYMVSFEAVSLVGLNANQVVAAQDVIFNAA